MRLVIMPRHLNISLLLEETLLLNEGLDNMKNIYVFVDIKSFFILHHIGFVKPH